MKKRIIVLILGALLMTGLNLNMVAFSAGNDNSIIAPCWKNTSSVHGHLTVDGTDGNLSVLIDGNPNVTKITATATLYYKNAANRWVKAGSAWDYSSNKDYLAIDQDFTAISGKTYKVIMSAEVYADGYTEYITQEFS